MSPRRAIIRSTSPAIGAVLAVVVLAACAPIGASPSVSTASSPSASAISSPAASPTVMPTSTPTTTPTDGLGAFTCDLPITGDGTVDRAQITDVRVGSHAGYDRVVIEFEDGIPAYRLDQANPPLLADPSGMTMDVEGTAFWSLVLQGGTSITPDGQPTYDGRIDFTPDFPALAELVNAGDFEAVSSWYIGLNGETCARVLTLGNPSRLVIDIQQ